MKKFLILIPIILSSCSWTYNFSEDIEYHDLDSIIFRNGHKYRRIRPYHYLDCGISDWEHGDTTGCYICSQNAHYMYKETELFEKVKGHIKDSELRLLKALVQDLNEFNKPGLFEIFIDFDDIGTNSEFDPYETFSIKIHGYNGTVENIHDYLTIHQLDDCLCAIESYEEEKQKILTYGN